MNFHQFVLSYFGRGGGCGGGMGLDLIGIDLGGVGGGYIYEQWLTLEKKMHYTETDLSAFYNTTALNYVSPAVLFYAHQR